MNKYISFLLIPVILLGVSGNNCHSIEIEEIDYSLPIEQLNLQYLEIIYSFFNDHNNKTSTLTYLLERNKISKYFRNRIYNIYNDLLSHIQYIYDNFDCINSSDSTIRDMYYEISMCILNLKNNINKILTAHDGSSVTEKIELEDSIINMISSFYNIAVEFAKVVKEDIKLANRQGSIDDNKSNDIMKHINKILYENIIHCGTFTPSIIIPECLSYYDDKLNQAMNDVYRNKGTSNNYDFIKDFEYLIEYFCERIKETNEVYNFRNTLSKDYDYIYFGFGNELLDLIYTFWRSQYTNDFFEQLFPMLEDYNDMLQSNDNDPKKEIKKRIDEYKNKLAINSLITLKQILEAFESGDLNCLYISEVFKKIIKSIIQNIDRQKDILQQLSNYINSNSSILKLLTNDNEQVMEQFYKEKSIKYEIEYLDVVKDTLNKKLRLLNEDIDVEELTSTLKQYDDNNMWNKKHKKRRRLKY